MGAFQIILIFGGGKGMPFSRNESAEDEKPAPIVMKTNIEIIFIVTDKPVLLDNRMYFRYQAKNNVAVNRPCTQAIQP